MEDASTQMQGCRDRAITKLADWAAGGPPPDPNDPDFVFCRNYGQRQAAGEFDPEYKREFVWSQEQGCSCHAKPRRSAGGFTTDHLPTCGIFTWKEHERAERRERVEALGELQRQRYGGVEPTVQGLRR